MSQLYISLIDNTIYSGHMVGGSIPIPIPKSKYYKLKDNWKESVSDPWEFDKQSVIIKLTAKIKDDYDKSVEELILSHYPKSEPLSWEYQRQEAEKWNSLSSEQKSAAVSDLEFIWLFNACYPDGREIEISVIDAFASRIIENAKSFKELTSKLLGTKRKRLAELQQATDEELEVMAKELL